MGNDEKEFEFIEVSSNEKFEEIDPLSVNVGELKPAYILNHRSDLVLLRWMYVGGNWQNKNCPVGQTCSNPDINVCRTTHQIIEIGVVPCGVNNTIQAVFRNSQGVERNFSIQNSFIDCSIARQIYIMNR